MNYAHTIQNENSDCGVAVLATILKRFRIPTKHLENQINKSFQLTGQESMVDQGISLLIMKKTLSSYGIKSECYKIDNIQELLEQSVPFIARVYNEKLPHYIVVHEIKNNILVVSDPSKQEITNISFTTFKNIFANYAVCIESYSKKNHKDNAHSVSRLLLTTAVNDLTFYTKFLLIVCMILTFILPIAITEFLALILSDYLETLNFSLFLALVTVSSIGLIFLYFSMNYITTTRIILNNKIQEKVIASFYNQAINNTSSNGNIDSLSAYFWNVLSAVQGLVSKLFLSYSMLYVLFLLSVMFIYNHLLFYVLIGWMLVIFICLKNYAVKISKGFQENLNSSNHYASTFVKFIQTNLDLQSFKRTVSATNDLTMHMHEYFSKNLTYANVQVKFQAIIQSCITGMMLTLIGFYLYLFSVHRIDILDNIDSGIYLLFIITAGFSGIFNEYIEYVQSKDSIEYLNRKEIFNFSKKQNSNELSTKVPSSMITSVNCNHLSFTYGEKRIKFPPITLKPNILTSIHGQNGVGKSTLLKIMSGILIPTSGLISLHTDDNVTTEISSENLLNLTSLYNPEMALFEQSTINNVFLNVFSSVPNKKANKDTLNKYKKYKRLLQVDLADDYMVSSQGKNLSSGQIQKLLLLRTIMSEKKIYLFDEPTTNLDDSSVRGFYKIIDSLIQSNKFVVMVNHDSRLYKNAHLDFYIGG